MGALPVRIGSCPNGNSTVNPPGARICWRKVWAFAYTKLIVRPMAKHLITSALPYVNGVKHLGNLVGSMLPADVYASIRCAGYRVTNRACPS